MQRGAKKMILFSRLPAIISAWAALTGAAFAFFDSSTGFGIKPPAPFTTEPTSRRNFDVGVGISAPDGKPPRAGTSPYPCEAGFKAAPQNNNLSRNDINKLIVSKEWIGIARTTLETVFAIDAQGHFMLAGYRGIEFHARPKFGPDAETVRMMLSIIETPKGRVTVICGTTAAAFKPSLKTFRAIRATVSLPE